MKDFDKFQDFLNTLEVIVPNPRWKNQEIVFMGKEGNENIPFYDGDDKNPAFRTDARLICYYPYSRSIEYKSVYLNTKGHHIKFARKNVYIQLSDTHGIKYLF